MRRREDNSLCSKAARELLAAKKAKKGMRFVYPELDRHLTLRVYFKRPSLFGGRKIPMTSPIGSIAFRHEHANLLDGILSNAAPAPTVVSVSAPANRAGTLGWLVAEYKASSQFKGLSVSTRRSRASILTYIVAEPSPGRNGVRFGECPLSGFTSRHVKDLRDRRLVWKNVSDEDDNDEDKIRTNTESANSRVKALRAVFAWGLAERADDVETNPARDVALYKPSSDGWHAWTLAEVEQYRRTHALGTKARLALDVLLFSLQRRGDAIKIGEGVLQTKVGSAMFVFEQEKTGKKAYVPYVPELRHTVANTSCAGSQYFICQDDLRPYTKESFGNMMRDWCDEAGLPQCSAHGLRKAGIIELVRRQYTPHQIMAISGHSTLKEIDRYARDFARENAAEQVLEGWEAALRRAA